MKTAEWFFDFVSPFGYLQLERMAPVEERLQVTLTPVLFAAILKVWGQKGPAEIPAKRRFTYRFVQWQAEREGIELKFPPTHPFNPLKALRLAIAAGCLKPWKRLCEEIGVGDPSVIDDPGVKDELRRNGQRAVEAQIFGVPAFVVDHEIFWGFDSMGMLLDYLRDPHRFARGELNRVLGLPGLPG